MRSSREAIREVWLGEVTHRGPITRSSRSVFCLEFGLFGQPQLRHRGSSPGPHQRLARAAISTSRSTTSPTPAQPSPPATPGPQHGSPEADCRVTSPWSFDPDVRRRVKVCPGVRRVRTVHVSVNKSLDLYFKRLGPVGDDRFGMMRLLVQFTVQFFV